MNKTMKDKIEHAHTLACAVQMLISFAERPDFLGGPVDVVGGINELVRQGGYLGPFGPVTRDEIVAEFERITGEKVV